MTKQARKGQVTAGKGQRPHSSPASGSVTLAGDRKHGVWETPTFCSISLILRGNETQRRSESYPRPHSDLRRIYKVRKAPGNLLACSPRSNTFRRGWEPGSRRLHVLPSPCSQRARASEKWKPRLSRQAAVSSLSRHPQLLTPNPHVFETRGKEGGPAGSDEGG